MSLFYKGISTLKGVGKKRAELFLKLGVGNIGALLQFYPRSYRDFSHFTNIEDVKDGETACLKAKLESEITVIHTSNNLLLSKCLIGDETASIEAVFFNNPYIKNTIKPYCEYVFFGKIKYLYGSCFQIVSPIYRNANSCAKIEPIYPQTQGLSTNIIKNCIKNALQLLPTDINDTLPTDLQEKFNLCSLKFALENIHFPKDTKSLEKAKYRLSFEELLTFYLALKNMKKKTAKPNLGNIKKSFINDFIPLLDFTLTKSQTTVLNECFNDMINGQFAMSRMIQGDVGCGKTVVAAALAFCAVKNKTQAVIMAPTEILSEQHFMFFNTLFQNSDINIELLTSSVPQRKKNIIYENLENGKTDILIGTHAVLSDKVHFKNLSLIIVDEQHKFGVEQRKILINKGKNPHIVFMSATPIPRSLALILFGEYDISTIDEIPDNRPKIKTYLVGENKRSSVFTFIYKTIKQGHQAYIVCPSIDENPDFDLMSLEEYEQLIKHSVISTCRYAFLNGKMRDTQKQDLFSKFSLGEIDLLISTTVIEVGIDVANACVILIENAERFGFSQLHQLRGRVGRSNLQSYCILLTGNESEETKKRLDILCKTTDGFVIAQKDLELRGAGDFFGVRQHGELNEELLKQISNTTILKNITDAFQFIENDGGLFAPKYRFLKKQIELKLENKFPGEI